MRRYHNPDYQGLFAHKYPEDGYGFVQPRGNLFHSIVPLNYRLLPALVTEALRTLQSCVAEENYMPGER